MASVSNNPFADIRALAHCLRAASGSSRSLCPALLEGTTVLRGRQPFASHCCLKPSSHSAEATAPHGTERKRCLSLASEEPRVSEHEPEEIP